MKAFEFWQAVANTPWWAYLYFLYMIVLSFRTTKPQQIPIKLLIIYPIVFALLSFACMIWLIHVTPKNISYWAAAIVAGIIIGWAQYRIKNVKAIQDSKALYVPRTYLFVAFICAAIFAKFYYGYSPNLMSMHISITTFSKIWSDKLMVLSGLLIGLLCGRFLYARKVIDHGPYVTAM